VTYLTVVHQHQRVSGSFTLNEDQKVITNVILYQILKEIGDPEEVGRLTGRGNPSATSATVGEKKVGVTTRSAAKGIQTRETFERKEKRYNTRAATRAASRAGEFEAARAKHTGNALYVNFMNYVDQYVEGSLETPVVNSIAIKF
jgi:hypothetical protein